MATKVSESTATSMQRALVIGVSDYPRPEDKLPAVAADVREMAKVLSSKHGTFPSSGINVLADKQATRDAVLAALHSAFGSKSADTTFVYLAGHGFESGGRYYYVAYDTTSEATAVPLVEIKKLFDQTKSRRAFLWLDFCHSGGILARGGSGGMDAIRRGIGVVSGYGKVIVAACTSTQKSYESSSIGHGFFTHALLRGLKGEAKSAQGEVTAHSLYEFIDHQVANHQQQPVFFGETTGRIVLMHYDKAAPKKRPSKKTPSSPRPKKSTAKIKGSWVMLGDNFLVAERVRNHSDGSIELAITPQSGEQEAAVAALRPTQFGGIRDLAYAANNDARQVRVEQVIDETSDGKQIWTVKLRATERQSSFAQEVSVQGMGPDEIARLRVGRILLNDPPPRTATRSGGYHDADFIDGFVSGAMTGFEIKECVVRSMYQVHGQIGDWKEFARLKSIYLMKMTGTVEHVLELKIGAVRGGMVSVSFRGRRPQRYSNVDPETIELEGKCPLE
jgi:uncharacterized caspase-like protein